MAVGVQERVEILACMTLTGGTLECFMGIIEKLRHSPVHGEVSL